jgi:FixJ family two-component response regulator
MTNDAAKGQPGMMLQRPPPLAKNAATMRRTASRNSAAPESIVFIVDDDAAMREALQNLLQSVGLAAEVFGSAAELLASKLPDVASCLVLDIRMPGMSGLEFQTQLARANIHTPIIFMTGHGDIPMTPFAPPHWRPRAPAAPARPPRRREGEKLAAELRTLFETLTPREREVMALVASGSMNKQVAGEIGITETTVKVHRGQVMRKMGARSLADLVRMAEILELHPGNRG